MLILILFISYTGSSKLQEIDLEPFIIIVLIIACVLTEGFSFQWVSLSSGSLCVVKE